MKMTENIDRLFIEYIAGGRLYSVNDILTLKSNLGVDPSPHAIREGYIAALRNKNARGLNEKLTRAGLKIPEIQEEIIQEIYSKFLKHKLVTMIIQTYNTVKVKPKFPCKKVQKIYEGAIYKDDDFLWRFSLENLLSFKEITGIKPKTLDPDKIQKRFDFFYEYNQFDRIENLERLIEIKSKQSEKSIKRNAKNKNIELFIEMGCKLSRCNWFSNRKKYKKMKKILEESKKKNYYEELINTVYGDIFRYNELSRNISSLEKKLNIYAPKEVLEKNIINYIGGEKYWDIKYLKELTGIDPIALDSKKINDKVQEQYKKYLTALHSQPFYEDLRELKDLIEFVGIPISYETAQEMYKGYTKYTYNADIVKKSLRHIEMLEKLSGIKPSEEILSKFKSEIRGS